MKKFTALACALALAGASQAASAADQWNGAYAGASLGHVQYTPKWFDKDYDWFGSTMQTHDKSQSLGLQVGYNHQIKHWVVGAELGYTAFNNASSYFYYSNNVYQNNQLESLISLRAKAGLAVDKTMVYITLGMGQVEASHMWTEDDDIPDSWKPFQNSSIGTQVGMGIESKVSSNFSLRGEVVKGRSGTESSTNPIDFTMSVTDHYTLVNLGANFQF